MQIFFTKEKKKKEMQCNVSLLHGKNIEEEYLFFLFTMQRKDLFLFSMCIFYNATFFFLSCTFAMMQTCYMEEKKEPHLLLFFATTQKKKSFLLIACFFGFFLATIFLFLCYME
jgi:hypothetical protein